MSFTEIIVDTYLRSLQEIYYYPLSTELSSTEVQIGSNGAADGSPPLSPALGGTVMHNNHKITIEDSEEAISDLIAEKSKLQMSCNLLHLSHDRRG